MTTALALPLKLLSQQVGITVSCIFYVNKKHFLDFKEIMASLYLSQDRATL